MKIINLIIILLFSAGELCAYIRTDVIYPKKDSYMNEASTTTDYATNDSISVAAKTGSNIKRRGIIHFDLTQIPATATVSAVTIELYTKTSRGVTRTISFHKVNAGRDWQNQTKITWNKWKGSGSGQDWTTAGGDYNAAATVSNGLIFPGDLGSYQSWSSADLLTEVQDFVTNPGNNNGWILIDNSEGDGSGDFWSFYSNDASNDSIRPRITVTFSAPDLVTCTPCDVDVRTIEVDLSTQADSIWTIDTTRNGLCCGITGSVKCIKFNITLHPRTEELSFEVTNPAPQSSCPNIQGSYFLNCGECNSLNDTVCVVGMASPICLTYCQAGNNSPEYKISVSRQSGISDDITIRKPCSDTMLVMGFIESSIEWKSVYPGVDGTYNSYLSCTTACDTVVVTVLDADTPPDSIAYEVSGTAAGCGSGTSRDTIWVFLTEPMSGEITPPDPSICSGQTGVTLTGTARGGAKPYTFSWTGPDITPISSTDSTSVISAGDIGIYTFTAYDTSDCDPVIDTVEVTRFIAPIDANAGPDDTVCASSPATDLAGTVTYASGGIWSSLSGSPGVFSPSADSLNTNYTPSLAEVVAGFVNLKLLSTGNRGCTPDSDTVVIRIFAVPTANAGPDDTICAGLTFTTSGSIGGAATSQTWRTTGDGTFSDPNIPASVYTPGVDDRSSGSVRLIFITDTPTPCTFARDTMRLVILTSPTSVISPDPASVCASTVLGMNGNPAGGTLPYASHLWTGDTGPLSSTAIQAPTFTTAVAGAYALTYTVTDANGCTGTDAITVTVNAKPTSAISPDPASVCASTALGMNGNPAGGTLPYASHLWTGDTGPLSSTAIQAPTFTTAVAGAYALTYTVTDANGCTGTDAITVTVNVRPTSGVTPDPAVVCTSTDLAMNGNPAGGALPYASHLWTGDTGPLSLTTVQTPTFNSAAAGPFALTYTVTDANGCTGSDGITVTVNAKPTATITPDPATVCTSTNLGMNGNPAGGSGVYTTHLWTGDTGPLSSTVVSAPTFNSVAAGSFALTYTVTDDKGCTGSDGITVTVNAKPTAIISPDPATVCTSTDLAMNGNPAGGTGVYTTHLWTGDTGPLSSTAVQAPTFTTAVAGAYALTYTVTDANGCTGTDAITVTVNAKPTSAISPDPASVCASTTLGMNGNPAGGTLPYASHLWTGDTGPLSSTAIQAPTFTTAVAGAYALTYTVTDANGCTGTDAITVTVNAKPTSAISPDPASVCASTTLGMNGNPAGGTLPYASHLWTGDTGPLASTAIQAPTFTTAVAGAYAITYTVTDANGCTGTDAVTVTVNVRPTSSVTPDPAVVCTSTDLAMNGNPAGGTLPYASHLWAGATGPLSSTTVPAPTFNSAAAGPFALTYTVTDANGCTGSDGITVTVNAKPTATITPDPATVCTSTNLGMNGNPAGGSGVYTTHLWTGDTGPLSSTVVSAPTFNSAAAGSFALTYTVTDDKGCTGSDGITVTVNAKPTATISPDPATACTSTDLAMNGNPAGGTGVYTTHLWTGDTGPLSSTAVQAPTFNTAVAGAYALTYTVTDANGCTGTDNITVTVNTKPTAGITPDPAEVCEATDLGLNGNPVGGSGVYTTHTWTGDTGPLSSTAIQAPILNAAANGSYALTYTVTDDNGCSGSDDITVTVNDNPTAAATPDPATVCKNSSLVMNGNPADGSGVYSTHLWTGDTGPLSSTTVQTPTFNSASAGAFALTYTVTDDQGCSGSDGILVNVNPTPSIDSSITTPNTSCVAPNGTLIIYASGGTPAFQYSDNGGGSFQPDSNFAGLTGGIYSLVVRDANSCQATGSNTVGTTVGPVIDSIKVTNVLCRGNSTGAITIYATGATHATPYSIDSGATYQADSNFTGLAAGVYDIVVRDAGSCLARSTSTITQPAVLLSVNITPDPASVCTGVNLSMNGNPAGGTLPYASHLWTGDTGPLSSTTVQSPVFNSALSGPFALTYTITDANSCTATDIITVNVNASPTAAIAPDPAEVCVNVNLGLNGTPAGGTLPYTAHLWTGSTSPLSSTAIQAPTFNSSSTGSFALTYRVTDNNGCTGTDNITVTVNANPTAGVTPDPATICATVNIGMNGNPAGGSGVFSTHRWSGANSPLNDTAIVSPTFNSVAAGAFALTYTVTDSKGCIGSDNITVNVNPRPTAGITPDPSEFCVGVSNAMNGNPAGGSGIYSTHLWTGGVAPLSSTAVSTPTFNSASAGAFALTYTVTDDNGCVGTDALTVDVFANPTASITPDPAEICVGSSLTVNGNPAGGTGVYSHTWTEDTIPLSTTTSASPVFNSSLAGIFNLIYRVTDDKGCIGKDTINVVANGNPTSAITPDPAGVCVGLNLSMSGNPAGGSAPLVHRWSGANGPLNDTTVAAPVFNSSSGGSFALTYTVTDNKGCIGQDTITVVVNSNPASAITPAAAEVCVGIDLGLNGNPAGGSGSYSTHLWTGDVATLTSTSVAAPTFNSSSAGAFGLRYKVTDSNGCIGTDSINVTVNANPTVSVTPTPAVVCVGLNLGMNGNPAGGSGSYSIHLWTGDTGPLSSTIIQSPVFNSLSDGLFNLTYTVTDSKGCIRAGSRAVTANPNPTASVTPDPAEVCAGKNLGMNGNPAGGSGIYLTHQWSRDNIPLNDTAISNPVFNTVADGTFDLIYTVTDDKICIGSDSMSVLVNAMDNPYFTYASATYCVTGTDPAPDSIAKPGGVFSDSTGLMALNIITGLIDLSATPLGTYRVKYKTVGVCPDSSYFNITITVSPDATFDYGDPFCQGDPNVFPIFPPGASAGVFSATPVGLDFANVSTGEINLIASTAGTYSVTNYIAAGGGCSADTGYSTIEVNPRALVNAGLNDTICEGSASSLSTATMGGSATSVRWTTSGSGSFNDTTLLNPVYSPGASDISTGSVKLFIRTNDPDTAGPCQAVRDSMTLTIRLQPIASAGPDSAICSGAVYSPPGTMGGGSSSVLWTTTGDGVFDTATKVNPVYTPGVSDIGSGTVRLKITSDDPAGPCTLARDSMTLTINPAPNTEAGLDTNICAGSSYTVVGASFGGSATSILWTTSGSGTFDDTTILVPTYTPSPADIAGDSVYLKIITDDPDGPIGVCQAARDSLKITIQATIIVSAGVDVYACKNSPLISLSGSVSGGTTTGIWSTPGTGIFAPSSTSLVATYDASPDTILDSLDIILTSTFNGVCPAKTDTMRLYFASQPVVEAGPPGTVCANNPIFLMGTVTGGAGTGIWTSGGTGTFDDSTKLDAIYALTAGDIAAGSVMFTLTSTNAPGCPIATDSVLISITLAPTVDAGTDDSICANNDTVSIIGSVSGPTITGRWSSAGGGTFILNDSALTAKYKPSAADKDSGIFYIVLTSTNYPPCVVTDTMRVKFTIIPIADAGQDTLVCKGDNMPLNGKVTGAASSGVWSTADGTGTFDDSTKLNAIYFPSDADTTAASVTFVLTSTNNGTCLPDYDTLLVTFSTRPVVDAIPASVTVCANNDTVSLTGSVTGITTLGRWTTSGSGVFVPNDTDMTVLYLPSGADDTAGIVRIYLSSRNSCLVTDSVIVTMTPAPNVKAGNDQVVCVFDTVVVLTGSSVTGGATTGRWITLGTGTFNPNDSTLGATAKYLISTDDSISKGATLILTSTNNGTCLAETDTMKFTITTVPVVDAGAAITVCANNADIPLFGTITGGASTGVWTTNGNGTFSDSSKMNPTYFTSPSDAAMGSVTLTLTSTGACVNVSDSVTYPIDPSPLVNAGVDDTVCSNKPIAQLMGSVTLSSTTGKWTVFGGGILSPGFTDMNPTYTASPADTAAGKVTFVLTSTAPQGLCFPVTDTMKLFFSSSPFVNAGNDQVICNGNNAILTGTISGGASKGKWTTTGAGTFIPNDTALNITYIPGPGDTSAVPNTISFFLSSTNNGDCNAVSDLVNVTFTPKPVVDAGADDTVCANNINVFLNGSVSGSSTTGRWSSNGDGIFSPNDSVLTATYIPGIADKAAGNAVLVLQSTNSCIIIDSMRIMITPAPVVSAGQDQYFCTDTAKVRLSGSVTLGATTGIWTSNGTGTFDDAAKLNAVYSPSSLDTSIGIVTLILTSTNNGNCIAVKDTMNANFVPEPKVIAGDDQIVCGNRKVNLSGKVIGGTGTASWKTTGSGTFSPDTNTLNATYTFSTADTSNLSIMMILSTAASGGCLAKTDTMIVFITPAPWVNAGPDTIKVCANNSIVQLSGSVSGGATTGRWTTSGNGTFTLNDSALTGQYSPTPLDTAAGKVLLTLTSTTNGECNSEMDTVWVIITPSPWINAGGDKFGCNGASVILSGSAAGATSTGRWATDGTGSFSPNDSTPLVTYIPGSADTSKILTFTLTASGFGNCTVVTDTMKVTYTLPPFVDAGPNDTVCANNSLVTLNGTVSGSSTTGIWSTSGYGTFNDSSLLNAIYTPADTDKFIGFAVLTLSSVNACLVTDTMIVTLTPSPLVNAGDNVIICYSDTAAQLNGSVTLGATTGRWTTGGTGSFTPNDSVLNAKYIRSNIDSLAGKVTLVLTSTNNGNCIEVRDTMTVTMTTVPIVFAGLDDTVCANVDVVLDGSVTGGAGTGVWGTLGNGTFADSSKLDSTYTFGTSDTAIGNVLLVLTSTNACKDISDTINITITPAPDVIATTLGGACSNTDSIFMQGSVSIAGGVIWSTTGGGTFAPNDTILSPAYLLDTADVSAGFVDIIITSTDNGICNAETYTLKLIVAPQPVVEAGSNQNVCLDAKNAFLNGKVTGVTSTGRWTSSGAGYMFVPNDSTLNAVYVPGIADTTAGVVKLFLTSTNNGDCESVQDSIIITWTRRPAVQVSNDTAVCSGTGGIPLSGSVTGGTTTGIWTTTGTGVFSPDDTSMNAVYIPSASDDSIGFVTLSLTATGGCAATRADMDIVINPTPKASYATLLPCNSLSAAFTDKSSISRGSITGWRWNFGDNDTDTINQNTVHAYDSAGNYSTKLVIVSDKNCLDSATSGISARIVSAGYVFSGNCLSDGASFADTSKIFNDSIVSRTWDFGDSSGDTVQNPLHLYSASGTYSAKLIVNTLAGCTDSVLLNIAINGYPVPGFTIDNIEPNPNEVINFKDISSGAISWLWNFGDGINSSDQNPSHSYPQRGVYSVIQTVTNSFGCSDTALKTIEIEGIFMPEVPTGFSPNEDGENDILFVKGGPFTSLNFKIYNEWGQLIYESNNQKDGWDGKRDGVNQPVGVYIWLLKATNLEGIEYELNGDVTLLR